MKKVLCIFAASMFAIAVSGQSFVQESVSNKTSVANQSLFDYNFGFESVKPVLSEVLQSVEYNSAKLSEEAIIQIDSIVVGEYDKTTEMWKRTGKYKLGYENSDTASYYNTYVWNDTTFAWDVYPQEIKKFDANGNIIQWIVFNGNTDGRKYQYYSKMEHFYTYSTEGKTENIVTYLNDFILNEFVLYQKEEIVWDSKGNKIHVLTLEWNTQEEGRWQPWKEEEMEYDENGYLILNALNTFNTFSKEWYGIYKKTFVFDAEGNELQQITYLWKGETGKWMPNQKFEFSNYINKTPTVQIIFNWDNETEKWKQNSKEEKELDSTGATTFVAQFEWDVTLNDWLQTQKINYEFNNNSQMTLLVAYRWNKTDGTWQGNGKTVQDYNENGKLLFSAQYEWGEILKDWLGQQKEVYEYDEIGNQLLVSKYSWDNISNDWKYDTHISKTEYEYNPDINNYSAINYFWHITDSLWVKLSKEEYAKKDNNKYNLEASYAWNKSKEEWNLRYKNELVFNEEGSTTLNIRINSNAGFLQGSKTENKFSEDGRYRMYSQYNWYNELQKWIGSTKTSYQYLDSTHLDTITRFAWDFESDDWTPNTREVYFYTQTAIENEKQTAKSGINVYPNPTNDFITFDFESPSETAKLELFDLSGKKLLDRQISSGEKVSVKQMKNGVYIWRLTQNQQIFNGKIVVR